MRVWESITLLISCLFISERNIILLLRRNDFLFCRLILYIIYFFTHTKREFVYYIYYCAKRSTICNLPREHISHTMCMNVSIYIPVYICIYTFLQKRENNARLSHIFLLRCSFAEIDSEVRWVTDVHRFRN